MFPVHSPGHVTHHASLVTSHVTRHTSLLLHSECQATGVLFPALLTSCHTLTCVTSPTKSSRQKIPSPETPARPSPEIPSPSDLEINPPFPFAAVDTNEVLTFTPRTFDTPH